MDEGQDQILIKDGLAYEDIEAILSNLYQQNQKMEKEMTEFRAVAMKQSEAMEKNDYVVAKLEYRINEQDREMKAMKQEIRNLRTNEDDKETIMKQVVRENRKCVAELQSAKKIIKYIEKVVNELSHEKIESDPRKAIIKNSKKVDFSQNRKIKNSFREITTDLVKNNSMRTDMNFSISEIQGRNNIRALRTDINRHSEGGNGINQQFKNRKGVLPKRDIINIAAEGVAFSAYLDHQIQHMGAGHHIICNQVLLNDGNHYNTFTGIFTVPQTGVYLLTFNFGVKTTNDDWTEVRLVVNNREIVDAAVQMTGSVSHREASGNTAIIQLTQGESVWLENRQTDSEISSGAAWRFTTFSGVLLY